MKRTIVDYYKDENGDWVAELDCCHGQHVRHKPPFINRPWVEQQAGRDAMLGEELNCVRCDRLEWPHGLVAYKQTPDFTETTTPKGLLKDHSTKAGVWGRIKVKQGLLDYRLITGQTFELDSSTEGIVVPTLMHHVSPRGTALFCVEFYRKEK
jgi:tellurite methyltransferase